MSSRTSSRSTLTMVPSTMSPSLKYLIVLSMAARKSSLEPMSLTATCGEVTVGLGILLGCSGQVEVVGTVLTYLSRLLDWIHAGQTRLRAWDADSSKSLRQRQYLPPNTTVRTRPPMPLRRSSGRLPPLGRG